MKNFLRIVPALFAGFTIFAGLPMLGWGLTRLSDFFSNPVRTAYVFIILALQVLSLIYNPQVGRSNENRRSGQPGHKLDLVLIQVFSLAVVILSPFSDRSGIGNFNIGDTIRWIGLIVMLPGFALMQAGEKYLAKQFSIEVTLQKDHQLIRNGPYRFVRHPRYLGILIFFTGIAFIFRSLMGLGMVLALGLVLVWRIFAEEQLMQQEFGQEWEEYRAQTWRLVPFIF